MCYLKALMTDIFNRIFREIEDTNLIVHIVMNIIGYELISSKNENKW